MKFFKKRAFLEPEIVEWQFEVLEWLADNLGGHQALRNAFLVTPTKLHFPVKAAAGPERAREMFALVKRHAGMSDWPCRLEEGASNRPSKVGHGLLIRHEGEQAPAGTFSIEGEEGEDVVIRYDPDTVNDPVALVATFAHELAHYWTACSDSPPPGGWDLWEPATDFAAVQMGFGIFLANSAFNFSQFHDVLEAGWQSSQSGYLSERSLLFALAIFSKITASDTNTIRDHLKPTLGKDFLKAQKQLETEFDRLGPFLDSA